MTTFMSNPKEARARSGRELRTCPALPAHARMLCRRFESCFSQVSAWSESRSPVALRLVSKCGGMPAERALPSTDTWLAPLPPLPAPEDGWSFLVNLGLPRTGTTSFALANAIVGMRARHSWCKHATSWNESCPHHVASKMVGVAPPFGAYNIETDLQAYDSVSDLPFFLVERQAYHEAARSTGVSSVSFVCTMRPKADWIESMLAHGTAGGEEMRDFYVRKLNGSRPVGSQLVHGGWHPLYRRHEERGAD